MSCRTSRRRSAPMAMSNGDLALPRARTRQQHRGHVRARDQQHDTDGRREDAQRHRELLTQARRPLAPIGDLQLADVLRHAAERRRIGL